MKRLPALVGPACISATLLVACASQDPRPPYSPLLVSGIESHRHVGTDDLLTAGLGIEGLRSPMPPAFADSSLPTAAELRRRAIWSNWRGIADLAPGGGFGELYGSLRNVPGSEYHGFAKLPGASQPHRVMLQVPDDFDADKRCLVVAASSGSRGIYGAIALAGSWGLSHRCAVAYTDKGAGTGYVDVGAGAVRSHRLDGTLAAIGDPGGEFTPHSFPDDARPTVAAKHAHSGDNPEADWGRHVQQAAQFALQVLGATRANETPYTFANTRVIATGVSNGGGAVLRAAELPGDWLDGVVAISPNIQSGDGGRALYDYASEAALYLPCALNASAFDGVAMARPAGKRSPMGDLRCESLHAVGMLRGTSATAQAEQAHAFLSSQGWSADALSAAALSSAFDLWRSVLVTYASSYARTPANAMPCGYRFAMLNAQGVARAPTAVEQAAWWSDASGIPPGTGVAIQETMASAGDVPLPGLNCLRSLWTGDGESGARLRAGVSAARAQLPRRGLPILVAHGASDGLIPEAFNSAPYARWTRAAGRNVRYWRVDNAQHFDAFLALPVMTAAYVPMLPYAFRGLDAMWAHLESGRPLPGDARIATRPRQAGAAGFAPLTSADLGESP